MLSVIVPVYNVEKYLHKCLDSILAQTERDFELILVDDGSSDASPSICDSYALKDDRIKVIHKPNGGVSSARNIGLDVAKGDYVTFIDSDDWVAPDYLEKLNERAKTLQCDIITSGLNWCYSDDRIEHDSLSQEPLLDLSKEPDLLKIISQHHYTAVLGKLYKLSTIKDNNLVFDTSIKFGEDRDFNIHFLNFAKNGSTTEYTGYYYRRDVAGSLSVLKLDHDYNSELDYWNKLNNLLANKKFFSLPSQQLLAHRLFYIISDSIVEISHQNNLKSSIKEIRTLFNSVKNWDSLRSRSGMISAPTLLKLLILYKQAVALSLYLKMR